MSKISFVTTQQITGSTVVGRILPLARALAAHHEVHLLVMAGAAEPAEPSIHVHDVGQLPFTRTEEGKQRMSGLSLVWRMKKNALLAARALVTIKPDVIVIVKPLPANVLGTALANVICRAKVIIDSDDFELTANTLTSSLQRAAIHWAQYTAVKIASAIVVATPFLQDIFTQLVNHKKPVVLIPTGLNIPPAPVTDPTPRLVYIGSISIASGHRIDLLPDILTSVRQVFPTIPLYIVGDGDDQAKLKEEFQTKNLSQVIFTGRFAPEKIDSQLTSNSILIDPIDTSITNRSKSSYRVARALANGLPVITSNIGIRSNLIPAALHEKFFATAADAKSYAAKIIAVLQTPLTTQEKSLLTTKAQEYTWDVLAKKFTVLL